MAKVSEQPKFDGPDGESYGVALTVNSLCSLEEQFGGKSITTVGEDIASGRAGARGVRALFQAALLEDHPDVTPQEAGRLVDHLGAGKASEVIMAAFEQVQSGLEEKVQDLPEVDQRGRLSFDAGGERLVLVFGMNAQAELEDYFDGLQPAEIAEKIGKKEIALRDLRAMLRCALFDDRDVTLEEAGRIIDRIGLRVAGSAIAKAFVGAFPDAAEKMVEEEEGGNRRQRRAAARKHPSKKPPKGGTGKR